MLGFKGIHNFRDYGGYPAAGGGRVRSGLLFRSGQHHDATDADLARLEALGIQHVFDLRTDRERAFYPCRRPDGFAGQVHFVSDASAVRAPHVDAVRHRDAASTRAAMHRSYVNLPYRQPLGQAIRAMFAVLAAGEAGPSVVNCMAGKDRTGIAVMAVQHALGVHRDDIVHDYLLTNTAGNVEARIAAGYKTVRTLVGDLDDEARRVMMGVEPAYLEIAFAAITERSGSLDGWVEQEFGVDARMRAALRERFVEP